MSETKLASWSVPEIPFTIEYSFTVLDEIRRAVIEGYQKLSRGGIEVGGVLYGVREGETIRILATRPIVCEHARGPAFVFSENDRAALSAQLKEDARDPQLSGLVCVGWFVSHTRTGIILTESDLDIFDSFFPEQWQVTWVVRPGRSTNVRGGFFVREFDGAIRRESSYLEFNFPDRVTAIIERPPRSEPWLDRRARPQPIREEANGSAAAPEPPEIPQNLAPDHAPDLAPAPEAGPAAEFDVPQFLAQPRRRKWPWLVLWLILVGAVSYLGWRYFLAPQPAEPIGLTLAEKDGVLQVQWNRAAKPVSEAVRASLDINDGKQSRNVPLSTADLGRGAFSYQRSTSDVEVRLNLENAGGAKSQETTKFLGQARAPKKPDDTQAVQQRRDELQQEIDRLREQNAQQNARIQQLERTVRILQNRLGQK